jgi:hypothetical protein
MDNLKRALAGRFATDKLQPTWWKLLFDHLGKHRMKKKKNMQ